MPRTFRLQPEIRVLDGVDPSLPGIYQWEIVSADGLTQRYIGKYTRRRRPEREYRLNVERLLDGRPYRRNKPDGFRRIHRELAQAAVDGRRITLTFLENVPQSELGLRERELIQDRKATLNGTIIGVVHS